MGIERVAAVRAAVGEDITVLVDCHSRFERHTAPLVAERLALSNIGWFEEPLEPTKDPDGLAAVAAQVSMITAGGESGYGGDFFRDVVERRALNVVMPGCEVLRRRGGGLRRGQSRHRRGRRRFAAQPVRPAIPNRGRPRHRRYGPARCIWSMPSMKPNGAPKW